MMHAPQLRIFPFEVSYTMRQLFLTLAHHCRNPYLTTLSVGCTPSRISYPTWFRWPEAGKVVSDMLKSRGDSQYGRQLKKYGSDVNFEPAYSACREGESDHRCS